MIPPSTTRPTIQPRWPAALLAIILLWPITGFGQTAAPAAPAPPRAVAPSAAEASLSHAAAKAVTLKVGTFSLGTVIYAFGTGSWTAGGLLSAVNAAGSLVIFTANDYLWDHFWPNTNISANNEAFRPTTSLTRNTLKYLTFKPAVTVLNLGTIYWFTNSVAATAATGSVAIFALPAMFYLNNTLWDWYDWQAASAQPQAATARQVP